MYVNPSGTNPTGATIPTRRKREIYKIACDYDILILEDDPYYHLRFEKVI
jgi:DNA-binding transcriptional MocR family regulator